MTLLARVFRIDISACASCSGPMRVTRAFTTAEDIAAELHGARAPPRGPATGQLLLFSAVPRTLWAWPVDARRLCPGSSRRAWVLAAVALRSASGPRFAAYAFALPGSVPIHTRLQVRSLMTLLPRGPA